MKKISLNSMRFMVTISLVVLVIAAAVPAASAENIHNETYSEYINDYISVVKEAYNAADITPSGMFISKSMATPDFIQIYVATSASKTPNYATLPSTGQTTVTIYKSNLKNENLQYYGTGTLGYFKFKAGTTDYLQTWLEIDPGANYGIITGNTYLKFVKDNDNFVYPKLTGGDFSTILGSMFEGVQTSSPGYIARFGFANGNYFYDLNYVTHNIFIQGSWKTQLIIDSNDQYINDRADIQIIRSFPEAAYNADVYVLFGDTVYSSVAAHTDLSYYINDDNYPFTVAIKSLSGTWYNNTFFESTSGSDPTSDPTDNATVTVYVRNSQTGAAIANSQIVIDALVNGEYYPVVNSTEPSGIFSITLQPTGGGMPNPDGYRLIASADGYNNPMPEINFTVDEYTTSIYCYLDPIAGGPLDENKTFIDFFVRDMSANPISGATVNFGGYTLLTNSQGYTVFEVGKNATYTYTVSKSGYGHLTGNVVIGGDPRHTINTVLAPAVTPTTPTPIPTSTSISPTPTMTAPTGEPVSNWLEWFAGHFGMILGGGVEIGKIFMWLCFTVPVGVYVGKEAKAGAAGFMAGAGIVTLFFVLIGWVPIWLVVLLVLIIGLLYAKVFNSQDNGGGR